MAELSDSDLIPRDPDDMAEASHAEIMRKAEEEFASDGDRTKRYETQRTEQIAYLERIRARLKELEAQGNETSPAIKPGETWTALGGTHKMVELMNKMEVLERRRDALIEEMNRLKRESTK